MLNSLKKLLIVSLLLLGIGSQAMALDHEFSQEHWGASDHYCLAQLASHDDCLADLNTINLVAIRSIDSIQLLSHNTPYLTKRYSLKAPRAPPITPEI